MKTFSKNTSQSGPQTYTCCWYHLKPPFLLTVLKLFPTYWKSPGCRSRASWRGQSPRQTVPGSSPCESCQRMKRRMRSGGNYAPIGTRRSWSHSWVAENVRQGRGGEKRQCRRRRRETIPVTALGLFQKISWRHMQILCLSPFLSFYYPTLLQPRMCSSYIQQRPIWLGGAHDCDGSLEKGSGASIFIIRLTEQ